MRYGEKGRDVRDMQIAMRSHGVSVSVDGVLGPKTWAALQRLTEGAGKVWEPAVPDRALALLERRSHTAPIPESVVAHYDLRGTQSDPAPKTKVSKGRTVRRKASSIDTIVIHQTACRFGVAEYQLKEAEGNHQLALARRSLGVACHALAFRCGMYALPNDLRSYVHHAGPLNSRSLGLEIEGLYAGVEGNPATVWGQGSPDVLDGSTIAAGKAALRRLVDEAKHEGMSIRYIVAHRQSSATRLSDPGEDIWREIVLGFAVPVLGLEARPTFTAGDGNPIPVAWDPRGGVGDY